MKQNKRSLKEKINEAIEKKEFSLGSNREDAKEVVIQMTKFRLLALVAVLLGLVVGIAYLSNDTVKGIVGDEMVLGCTNGTKEVIIPGKEYYCGDHYTVLEGKLTEYDEIERRIKSE